MAVRKGAKAEPDKSVFSQTNTPKKSFSGVSPNLFIGSFGYPYVRVGALSSEDKEALDTPKDFLSKKVEDVVSHRQGFVNANLVLPVKKTQGRFLEQLQDIAKATQALDSEIDLERALINTTSFHQKSMPHGPSAALKKLELTSNAKVKRKVESITSDTDVRASEAIQELGEAQVDEHQLTKLLSSGSLGQKRKLVPTKWSITAVDDMRSKQLLEEVESFEDAHQHRFTSTLMGNSFHIYILPGAWSFELLEITYPHTIYNPSAEFLFSHDYEHPEGRKTYVQETAGAYYAARLAVLEYLRKIQRQARVIVLRCITPEYTAPLGVWIIREGIRQALQEKPRDVEHIKQEIIKTIPQKIPAQEVISELELLKFTQKRLFDF